MELVQEMSKYWAKVRWEESNEKDDQLYESSLLKLNCDKALHYLQWQAVLPFKETVRLTAEWYRSYYENLSRIRDVTLSQIQEYESYAKVKGIKWVM